MRQFICGLAFGLAAMAPASANLFYGNVATNNPTPRIVAGEINSGGVPIRGSGFTSEQIGKGQYEIHFNNNSIRGCAALTANVSADAGGYPVGVATSQIQCTRRFTVTIGDNVAGYRSEAFSFVAVQE